MLFKGFRLETVNYDLLGGYVNSYILETEKTVYIIDANVGSAEKEFAKALESFPVREKPVVLLCTHGHWDHVGLAGWLKESYGAKILAPEGSARFMQDPGSQLTALYDRFAKDRPSFMKGRTVYVSCPDPDGAGLFETMGQIDTDTLEESRVETHYEASSQYMGMTVTASLKDNDQVQLTFDNHTSTDFSIGGWGRPQEACLVTSNGEYWTKFDAWMGFKIETHSTNDFTLSFDGVEGEVRSLTIHEITSLVNGLPTFGRAADVTISFP